MTNVWHHAPGIDLRRRRDLRPVRQRRAHGALVPGARRGRADHRRRPDRHHGRGRRAARRARATSSITDVNPYRLELARDDGRHARRRRPHTQSIADVQRELGMKEGFDVGLEMSGSPAAFRDMLANMGHGGKIAHARASPARRSRSTGTASIFNMLTIKGIYGREMYETWYKMTVMLQSGLDISPVITHRFPYTEFEQALRRRRERRQSARSCSTGREADVRHDVRAQFAGRARRDRAPPGSTSPSA